MKISFKKFRKGDGNEKNNYSVTESKFRASASLKAISLACKILFDIAIKA
jgi:hypothetical protein